MNILFFLKPKSEVAYLYDDFSVRQALERMEYHRYTSIPVINREGEYVGSITEGDLLWGIKNKCNLNLKGAEVVPVKNLKEKPIINRFVPMRIWKISYYVQWNRILFR